MRARTLFGLTWVLLGLYVAATVLVWPRLPARIPIHFGLGGNPNRWTDTMESWFLLPAIAVTMVLMIQGLGWAARRTPQLWNVPEKERFLGLPSEQRAPIVATLEAFLGVAAVLVTLLFAAIQVGIYTTATGRTEGLPWYVDLAMVAVLVGLVGGEIVLNRAIRRRIVEAAPGEGDTGGGPGTRLPQRP